MTSEQLRTVLEKTNRTPQKIDEIIAKFEKSIDNRKAMNVQYRSYRIKINTMLKNLKIDSKDVRFFNWHRGLGIMVRRNLKDNTATVSFSFLNPNDIVEMTYTHDDYRSDNYHALCNFVEEKYTYTVPWRGRSEFAVYDAFVENHTNFPGKYKNFRMFVAVWDCTEEL